jgi:hypothetical protein
MTSNEAHNKAMEAAMNIAKWGVKTVIHPSRVPGNVKLSSSPKDLERADADQWCNVVFYPADHKQRKMIDGIRETLFDEGMRFDYGFGLSETTNELEEDWQLDWSFRYPTRC